MDTHYATEITMQRDTIMKIQTGMIFANKVAGPTHQRIVDRVENGFVYYSDINGNGGWMVSEGTFYKYHSIYCGRLA